MQPWWLHCLEGCEDVFFQLSVAACVRVTRHRAALIAALAEDYRLADPQTARARLLYMRKVDLFLLGFRAGRAK